MDTGTDDGDPSLIQNIVTSISEALANTEDSKIEHDGHSLCQQQGDEVMSPIPNKEQCIFVQIPANTLRQCSNLCQNQLLKLKGEATNEECSCKGNLDISVERKQDIIFLTLKAIGSSLQELAGNWNFVINSAGDIESCADPTDSKIWQDEETVSHKFNVSNVSQTQADSAQNKFGVDTSLMTGSIELRCDDMTEQQTEASITDNRQMTPETKDDTVDGSDNQQLSDMLSETEPRCPGMAKRKGLVRKRGRPRKTIRWEELSEMPIKQDTDVNNDSRSLNCVGYCCCHCSRVFRLQTAQKRHEAVCHLRLAKGNIVTCRRCREAFDELDQYEAHRERCRPEMASDPAHLSQVEMKQDDHKVCDVCFSIFRTRSRMLKHKQRIHPGQVHDLDDKKCGRYYPCKFCDQVFSNGSSRHRHQKFYCPHNPDCKRPHCCNQCGNFFTCEEDLHEHKQRRHKNAFAYICHLCGIKLTSRSSIYFHNLKRHSGRPPKFKCTHCDKAFYTRNKLEKHLTSHSNDRNIQCELCGKQFKTPQHVAQHKKTIHENRYRYRCEKCGHGMEKLQYLQSHKCGRVRRIQENEKTLPAFGTERGAQSALTDTTPVVSRTPSENIQEPMMAAPGLLSSQENAIVSHYLLPDINLITNYQTHVESGADPVAAGLAVPVSVNEQPYIVQASSPTYTQLTMSDNIRY